MEGSIKPLISTAEKSVSKKTKTKKQIKLKIFFQLHDCNCSGNVSHHVI